MVYYILIMIPEGVGIPIMEDGSRLPWICAVLLLFCAMYFAAAETAFASASRTRLRVAEDRGDRRARKALYVLDHFDQAISAILIGDRKSVV